MVRDLPREDENHEQDDGDHSDDGDHHRSLGRRQEAQLALGPEHEVVVDLDVAAVQFWVPKPFGFDGIRDPVRGISGKWCAAADTEAGVIGERRLAALGAVDGQGSTSAPPR
jgi:hypothetical protein